MPIEITIPRLGWSMEEANFVNWLKQDGEPVKSGEPLFTLESEKATQDIEASDSGILRIPNDGPKPGQVVKVGQVIGNLIAENEAHEKVCSPEHTAETHSSPQPSARSSLVRRGSHRSMPVQSEPETGSNVVGKDSFSITEERPETPTKPAISPRARRLAAQLGMDATSLRGSGRTGRIVEKDVREAANRVSSSGLSIMRRTIAQRTAASFSSTPHFYLRAEADVTALIRLRDDLLPEIERRVGVRLTLTDLLLRAQAKALKAFPAANAIWVDDKIVNLTAGDVGLVVGLPGGILNPIVRSPEAGELAALAQQRVSLVQSARSGKLTLEALQGGATSLSNLGNTRVDEFAAVIAPGQSTMLAVGRASPRPIAMEGRLAVRTTLRLCLSVDHRVLDGAPAAEFLGLIVHSLEEPGKLV